MEEKATSATTERGKIMFNAMKTVAAAACALAIVAGTAAPALANDDHENYAAHLAYENGEISETAKAYQDECADLKVAQDGDDFENYQAYMAAKNDWNGMAEWNGYNPMTDSDVHVRYLQWKNAKDGNDVFANYHKSLTK